MVVFGWMFVGFDEMDLFCLLVCKKSCDNSKLVWIRSGVGWVVGCVVFVLFMEWYGIFRLVLG